MADTPSQPSSEFTTDELWGFADLAFEFANAEGSCNRNNTGAVLVSPSRGVLAVGVNAIPGGLKCSEGDCPRGQLSYEQKPAYSDYSDCKAIHAEMNCINAVQEDKRGMLMIVTRPPCEKCKHVLDAAGIETLWVQTRRTSRKITLYQLIKKYGVKRDGNSGVFLKDAKAKKKER